MKSAPKHPREQQRLDSLHALKILDTLPEKDFDEITKIASQICGTPIALISLVDENRQWFKSKVGLTAEETPRDVAFCAHAILKPEAFVVPDSSKDERFADNPLVTGGPRVQFYAGVPLNSPEGYPIGTLCVIDSSPRNLDEKQIEALSALSNQVTRLLEIKKQLAEIEMAKSRLAFKITALENISEGVVLQDKTGAIIDFNEAALRVLGLSADQLVGKTSLDPDWQAIREDEAPFPGSEHPAMVCLKTGQVQKNVLMGIRQPNHSLRWLKINAIPLFHSGAKEASHCVCSFADITEQILDQKLISKNERDNRLLLDSVPIMIGHWSADLINLNANAIYSTYFGKNPEELKGLHMKDVVGAELFDKNFSNIEKVLDGQEVHFERDIPMKDGSIRNTSATYIPNIENGRTVSFFAIVTDVTEMKNADLQRRGLESQLAETAKLSALGEMAGGIAHEINNPLTIIQGRTALLKKKFENGGLDVATHLKDFVMIEDTVKRIKKVINGLKTYSRDAVGDPFEVVKYSTIIEDTLALCEERFKQSSVAIRTSCDPQLTVQCRSAQISQILMNLLTNSVDAVENLPEKWVDISVTSDGVMTKMVVSDSGSGIPEAVVAKMMQPFFTTKEVGKGTGLGLSISKGIAETHKGSFAYDSTAKHTTFVLCLPITQPEETKKAS